MVTGAAQSNCREVEEKLSTSKEKEERSRSRREDVEERSFLSLSARGGVGRFLFGRVIRAEPTHHPK